ncbi:MAG TPA: hypothetical protein GXZ60_02005 [Intrasporangiaceae bacterium]|nr:hypothetical protein [Intrasporangiaceae bacterium]
MNANERAIVADVQHVVDGGRDDSLRKVLYALYVAALLLITYGVSVAHAFFTTQDPQWLRAAVLSWPGALTVTTIITLALVAAWRAGRVRGPVLPPLPWIDLVVPGPLDRAITLRRWWVMAATLAGTGAAMVGAVIGGGAWFARVGDPGWLLVGALGTAVIGLVLLLVALAGQVSLGIPGLVPPVWRPREALRQLRLEDLRTQSSRATRMGGAVLLGDLRALRLEVATPVTRARHRRLRPGPRWASRWGVIVRRDLLGLRRAPGSGAIGTAVTVLAAAGLTWSLLQPAVPVVVALLAGLALHLGFSTTAEGLRLQGDNAGTPPLLGLSFRTEALAHLAVPLLLCGGSAVLTTALVGWLDGVRDAYLLGTVGWIALMILIVTGTTTASAFRGGAPVSAFLPGAGPQAMAFWVARQAIVAAAAVGGLAAAASRLPTGQVLLTGILLAMTCLWWGLQRVRSVALEHRV